MALGTNTPTNLGATQFTINDSNTAGTSGLISFTDSNVVKSYDYVNSNYRYVDTNTGVGIVLKPDADSTKAWVIDTDGDLVSNGGSWASGNAYMNNLIASSSVTASNLLVDNDINTNNLTADGNVTISGNLTVSGTTTYTSTNNLNVGDNIIELNYGGSATTGGILVKDATGVNTQSGSLLWDATNDYWKGGQLGSEKEFARLNSSLTQNTVLKANASGLLVDSNISDDGSTITLNSTTDITGVTTTTAVSSSLGFTSTAQKGLLIDNGDGYIQIGSGDVKTYLGQNDGSGYGYIETGDSGYNSDEFRILVGGTTMMHLSRADASDTGTNAVQIKNTDFSVDYDTLFVDVSADRVGINKIAPTVALDVVGDIAATGDITAYASSDRRLKDEIIPISNPIEKISQIGGYSFVWNTEKQHIYKGKDYGVIAQEIEEILPELVDTRENGYKAVKYDRLVSLLIEGIKELSEEVKELKEKINRE